MDPQLAGVLSYIYKVNWITLKLILMLEVINDNSDSEEGFDGENGKNRHRRVRGSLSICYLGAKWIVSSRNVSFEFFFQLIIPFSIPSSVTWIIDLKEV